MKFKIILFLIVIIFSNSFVVAQMMNSNVAVPGNNKTFSLDDCIDIALKNNLEIKIADTRITSSSADVTNAFGQFLPRVSLSSGYNRQLNAKPGFEFLNGSLVATDPKANSYNMSAGASLIIFDGFSRANNYNRAYETFNANDLNTKYTRQRIKLQIYQYYIDVIAKAQIVKIRRENIELGKKELEKIEALNKAGFIPIDLVYSQQADLGNKEYDLVTAENNLNNAKANLLVIMGLKPDFKTEFLESSLPEEIKTEDMLSFRKSIGSFNESIKSTFSNRLDYQAIEYQQKAYEANLDGSYSGYYPSLSASGGWSWSNTELADFSDFGRSSIGFTLSVPIFDQFSTNYRVQSAQVQLEQSKYEKEQLEQSIIANLQNAFFNIEAAEKQLEISEKALFSATRNFNAQQEKFRIGTASVTDYLTSNAQLITAQINRINSVYQYFKFQKEILFLMGNLN